MRVHICKLAASLLLAVAFARGAVSMDSLGEGTCVGYVPLAADTISDTSFHYGDTLVLNTGEAVTKPYPYQREQAAIPSVKTTVKIVAGDGFAHGKVTQVFRNPFSLPFEATYVFPLPHDGAVHAMDFETSTGVYHADLMEKEEAKQQYDQAKQEGKQAALLMQSQDNIFVQKLCNILPHDSVAVTITFSMALDYDMGSYELAFPTTMIPRYDPAPLPKQLAGGNPTYVPSDYRDGSSLDFAILILTPYDVADLVCPSHEVMIEGGQLTQKVRSLGLIGSKEVVPTEYNPGLLTLRAQSTIPNRDIVVRFSRANAERSVSALSYHDGREGYFALNIFSSLIDTVQDAPQAVDMVFVVDKSGSMSGQPMTKAKQIMHCMLDKVGPDDRISFLAFNSSTDSLFSVPAPATAENVAIARDWVDDLVASGGTEMLKGVQAGLAVPLEPGRVRIMSLITDGAIGGVQSIYSAISNDPSNTIVFAFGVGSSPNRELVDLAATAGNGVGRNLLLGDDVQQVVSDFFKRIRLPQIADISIGWGSDVPTALTLAEIPGLWLGQPILLYGKYSRPGRRTITLSGTKNGAAVSESYSVFFVYNSQVMEAVPKMWARETIENLMNEQAALGNESNKDSILSVSLAYNVLCTYTAFLAVADSVVNESGEMVAADVPIPVPVGVDPYMAGAYLVESYPNPSYYAVRSFDALIDTSAFIMPAHVIDGAVNAVAEPTLRIVRDGNTVMFTLKSLPESDVRGRIRIYDAAGRLVMSWTATELASRSFVWTWNYTSADGAALSKGTYVIVSDIPALRLVDRIVYR